MYDWSYPHEKLRASMETLAEHPGLIQARLADAVESQLHKVLDQADRWPDADLEARRMVLGERLMPASGTWGDHFAALDFMQGFPQPHEVLRGARISAFTWRPSFWPKCL